MKGKQQEMRRRKKKLILQLIAAGLICLLLLRFDLLAMFSHRSHAESDRTGLIGQLKDSKNIYEDHGKDTVEKHLRGNQRTGSDGKKTKNFLREMMEGIIWKKEVTMTKCEIPYFKNIPANESTKSSGCQRKKPAMSSCQLASQLFGEPAKKHFDHICSYQTAREFCKLEQDAFGAYQVSCDVSTCRDGISLGMVDIKTTEEIWTPMSSKKSLEESISILMNKEHVGYCLVRCGQDDRLGDPKYVPLVEDIDPSDPVSQILILPPVVKQSEHSRKEDFINFNFVFVDSVSRAHFFRSLPKSVNTIENIAMEMKSHSKSPVVLDFDLVQAVRSRTYESLQTMFSGIINPFEKPFGIQAMPRTKLKVKDLTADLHNFGYVTQWLEDLCPLWEWGIAKDFLVYDKSLSAAKMWEKLKETLNDVKVDSIGPTLSSCRILHANGHADPFHGPDRICYNGKPQHEYLLDYLYLFHQEMLKRNQPYFTFYETNIGHESSGLRIQQFDNSFSKYLEYVSSLENTLTVLFSDHGNAYGEFVTRTPEARTEMYNPFMFFIVPDKVQTFIGDQFMKSLARNQHRLISLLDVHYTLTYLIEHLYLVSNSIHKNSSNYAKSEVSEFNAQFNVSRFGLLTPISDLRTCSQIPRVMPNLCICEGYDSKSTNYDYNLILAMYVVGQLNNQLQEQRRKHLNEKGKFTGGFGRCHRMEVDKMVNIQRSTDGDHDIVKMDMYVKTPGQKQPEIFFIAITMDTLNEKVFQLQNYDRITPYSKYSVCADPGVDLGFCICDLDLFNLNTTNKKSNKAPGSNSSLSEKLRATADDVEISGVNCLKVIQRSGLYGAITEAFNGCTTSVSIYLEIAAENLILSPLEKAVLHPNDTTFLVAGVAMETDKAWDWDIDINVLESSDIPS